MSYCGVVSYASPYHLSLYVSRICIMLLLEDGEALHIEANANHQDVLNEASVMLRREHNIIYTTLQVENHDHMQDGRLQFLSRNKQI